MKLILPSSALNAMKAKDRKRFLEQFDGNVLKTPKAHEVYDGFVEWDEDDSSTVTKKAKKII